MENPADSPNAHFWYGMGVWDFEWSPVKMYEIRAYRNEVAGGGT